VTGATQPTARMAAMGGQGVLRPGASEWRQSADFRHSRAVNGNRMGERLTRLMGRAMPSRNAVLAHPTIYGLKDPGFVPCADAGHLIV
jgi:hypothetical protein